jgi:hypothetical protein
MILPRRTIRFSATLVVGALLLSGCQNMSDRQVTQAQSTGGGAVLGAVLGAVFGGARGAAIGSAAGAALGLGAGTLVAQRKQQYASDERFFDAQIQQTQARNWQLAQYNENLRRQIAGYNREIAMLQNQVEAGNVDLAVASRTHDRLQASYADCSRMLADSRRELKAQEQVAEELHRTAGEQAVQTRQEDAQVAALSRHVSVLQQQVDTLASQGNQLQQFR